MQKFVIAIVCAALFAPVSALPVKAADKATPPQVDSPAAPPSAGEWCGFKDDSGSVFRCGFSTLATCKAAVGDSKDSYCIPDPKFAETTTPGGHAARKSLPISAA